MLRTDNKKIRLLEVRANAH